MEGIAKAHTLSSSGSAAHTSGFIQLNRSIRSKLIVGALIVLLLIVGALTFVIARNAASLMEKESRNQLAQLLEQSTTILSSFLNANSANLELWAGEPLVHSVANDPALGAIFALGLNDYFDTHVSNKPWVKNIVLIKNEEVAYAQFDSPLFETDSAILRRLMALAFEGTAALNLNAVASDVDEGVVVMMRPLADETGSQEDSYILLLLDLTLIQETLFGQVKVGRNGFLTLAAELNLPKEHGLWLPPLNIEGETERAEFLAAHEQELLATRGERGFDSILIDHRRVQGSPLTVVGVAALRDVREPVTNFVYFAIACGLLASVIGIASIYFLSGRITAPIRELTAKAHEFASNRLKTEMLEASQGTAAKKQEVAVASVAGFDQFAGGDEVGELASVFRLLDERTAQLEQANSLLGIRNREIDEAMQTLQQTQNDLVTNLNRLERELAAARQLQLGMVPTLFPAVTSTQPVDIHALMEPAREVGGDLYDFFYADDDTLCFLLGDVADKGTSAALFMARTLSLIRFAVAQWNETTGQRPSVEQVMHSVNRELCQNNRSRMFVTLFLGLLNVRTGALEFANAGHIMPYVLRPGDNANLISTGPPNAPLGVTPNCQYRFMSLAIEPETTLFLYSDGIPEAVNLSGELYSQDRLRTNLATMHEQSSKDAIQGIKLDLDQFVGTAEQFDDVTLLSLKWRPRWDLRSDSRSQSAHQA